MLEPAYPPPAQDRQRLAHARTELAQFQRKGEERARQLGLTHAQHHLLLAVHTHPQDHPGVAMVADQLALRRNSAAELVNRTVVAGYLRRAPHDQDRRRVQLHLTRQAEQDLNALCQPQLTDLADLIQALAR